MAWSNRGHVSPATRRRILARDNHSCVICGHHDPTGKTLAVDHRDNTRGPNYDTDGNLQTLCHWHHDRKTYVETVAGRRRHVARGHHPGEAHPGLTR